jgi:hypothetical protein
VSRSERAPAHERDRSTPVARLPPRVFGCVSILFQARKSGLCAGRPGRLLRSARRLVLEPRRACRFAPARPGRLAIRRTDTDRLRLGGHRPCATARPQRNRHAGDDVAHDGHNTLGKPASSSRRAGNPEAELEGAASEPDSGRRCHGRRKQRHRSRRPRRVRASRCSSRGGRGPRSSSPARPVAGPTQPGSSGSVVPNGL